ncbi:MAG: hypothetical protein HKM24_01520 [Gammaproteobacteria bacterium]|nr:hypothetical protein [Gammaproteobacteria bacterium]
MNDQQTIINNARGFANQLNWLSETVPILPRLAPGFLRRELIHSLQLDGSQLTLNQWLQVELLGSLDDDLDSEHVAIMRRALRAFHVLSKDVDGAINIDELHLLYQRVGGDDAVAWVNSSESPVASVLKLLNRAQDLPRLARIGILYARLAINAPDQLSSKVASRLIIPIVSCEWRLLQLPLLSMSDYFLLNQKKYHNFLTLIKHDNNMTPWLEFFLQGAVGVLDDVVGRLQRMLALVDKDYQLLMTSKRGSLILARLFDKLIRHPVVTVASVAEGLQTTKPTATKAINSFEKMGILTEITGRGRDRIYQYQAFLDEFK